MNASEWHHLTVPNWSTVIVSAFVLPLLGAISTLLATRIGLRDARKRIRADLDLYGAIPEGFEGREALRSSIEEQIRRHSVGFQGFDRRHTRIATLFLVTLIVIVICGAILAFGPGNDDGARTVGRWLMVGGLTLIYVGCVIWSVVKVYVLGPGAERSRGLPTQTPPSS
jgi:phosphate/sulfate permease